MSKKVYQGTQAISRAVNLLMTFDDHRPEWSLVELGEATDLNRTTTYRIVSALENAGFVAYNPTTDRYRLGPEIIALGAKALRANPLRTVAHPVLEHLAEKTGEMASLEILEQDKTLILDEIKGHNQRRFNTSIGNLWPAHATSTGKVLLAHLPKAVLTERLSSPLTQMTPQTIIDPAELDLILNQVKLQGYAVAVNELEVGLTEVAVPIFNHAGEAVAAISIGSPTIRLPKRQIPGIVTLLKEASTTIAYQLGYRESQ